MRRGIGQMRLEAEPRGKLLAPLIAQAGRRDDEGAIGDAAQAELRENDAGLDGLSQPDLVGEEHT